MRATNLTTPATRTFGSANGSIRDADLCVRDHLGPSIDIACNKVPEIGPRLLIGRGSHGSKLLEPTDGILVRHRFCLGSMNLRHNVVGQSFRANNAVHASA